MNPNWFVGETYQEEIDWLKEWITKRLAWIEAQFPPAPAAQSGAKLVLTTPVPGAQIYFTLNGTDPRASGGGYAPDAQAYETPVTPPKNSKVFARVLVGTRWSAPTVLAGGR